MCTVSHNNRTEEPGQQKLEHVADLTDQVARMRAIADEIALHAASTDSAELALSAVRLMGLLRVAGESCEHLREELEADAMRFYL